MAVLGGTNLRFASWDFDTSAVDSQVGYCGIAAFPGRYPHIDMRSDDRWYLERQKRWFHSESTNGRWFGLLLTPHQVNQRVQELMDIAVSKGIIRLPADELATNMMRNLTFHIYTGQNSPLLAKAV